MAMIPQVTLSVHDVIVKMIGDKPMKLFVENKVDFKELDCVGFIVSFAHCAILNFFKGENTDI